GRTERPFMDATNKKSAGTIAPWPKQALTDHVRAAPEPVAPRPSREQAEAAVRTLLAFAGDDPAREGLLDVLDKTFGEIGSYNDFVLVKDITFNSHCEHHVMPFFGKAHIAYKPVDRVVGLSKLARLVDVYARRLQTQEHMTAQIATALIEILKPQGVAVMLEAEHMCMSIRGVTKPGSI